MITASLTLVLLTARAAHAGHAAPDRVVLPDAAVPVRYELSVVPDTAAMTFAGAVRIDLDVRRPTPRLELNAADLVFTRAAIAGVAAAPKIAYDPARQTATLTFPAPIAAGRRALSIEYAGKINLHASGLFALDYDTPRGRKRALFTQFENSDARRFLPCWDEPARKAVFSLTVTAPAGPLAVSNTPVAATAPLPGGLQRVRFAPTPKMSSYLLFLGLGDFERVSRKVGGVDVGVVVKRGDKDKAGYALETAAQILPYYEDYFGVKYPLPKLDLIGAPGESQFFSAMENWGAIMYFERAIEIDPKISTQGDRRNVYLVIAHEMAHQWFGDLVTMDWWDDLWLNEGFASWMEYKAADRFHPEWKVWLDAQGVKESAMRVDARRGTHPIVQPIHDVLQANQAFDAITYQKGEAVIRMLEDYLGAGPFRAGVRAYIKAHAYGNTVTDDLWRELDRASATPVTAVAHDFTTQAGVPLIRVASSKQGPRLSVSRYAEDESGKGRAAWRVPVIAGPAQGGTPWRGLATEGAATPLPADADVVNRGQTGYFRVLYDRAAFARAAGLFPDLAPADQMGLLNDSRALGFSGEEPLGDFMALTRRATPALDPYVLQTVAARLAAIDVLYKGLPGQAAFESYGRGLLEPVLAQLGWTPRPGEDQNTTLLRNAVSSALSQLDDQALVAEARRRFAAYLEDRGSLVGDTRRNVLAIVARHADADAWEQLHDLAKAAASTLEKRELYLLLGTTRDRALADRALTLALSDEPPVTLRPSILRSVSSEYPDAALDFFSTHYDAFREIIEPDSLTQYGPRLASSSCDLATIKKLRAFADKRIPESARGDELKAEASIAYNAKAREKRVPEIDRWIAADVAAPAGGQGRASKASK